MMIYNRRSIQEAGFARINCSLLFSLEKRDTRRSKVISLSISLSYNLHLTWASTTMTSRIWLIYFLIYQCIKSLQ